MNKLVVTILLLLCPALVLAADGSSGSLTFAPPASDYSVVFLGNLFGIVDGVLNGSGSQIMGSMFAVFNAAVLALGGIIIMYTLMVSTMNTAHEGQMLGQKWSSIWIPVRSTLGLALLIPKASGYCLMQIFVMWVVVQGVGAADKVWEAALSYLNRGGVIIQAQRSNPTDNLTKPETAAALPTGALKILSAEVCMIGLQKQLQTIRQNYLNDKQKGISSPCTNPTGTMADFCNTAVPDFISSVNAVAYQDARVGSKDFELPMPNFPTGSKYIRLNGVCGLLKWNEIDGLKDTNDAKGVKGTTTNTVIKNLTSSELQTTQMSRAIAISQMYQDLAAVAQVMVNNDPAINNTNNQSANNSKPYSLNATQQFGVPYTASGTVCADYKSTCVIWGPASTGSNSNGGVLFNGTEFQGAINDYNGIMAPTMNLLSIQAEDTNQAKSREFIKDATNRGWIMAGAYFFDLVTLNGNAAIKDLATDKNSGIDGSLGGFFGMSNGVCQTKYNDLCTWVGTEKNNLHRLKQIQALIDGTYVSAVDGEPVPGKAIQAPTLSANQIQSSTSVSTLQSSSVNAFVQNSMMIRLPGQPGLAPLQFANLIHFNVDPQPYYLEEQTFDCGEIKILFFSFCFGRLIGNIFYNAMFRYIYNAFMYMFQQIINQVIMSFLMIPITGMAAIFRKGMQTISAPGVNPIVALANMGVMYINFSANLWLMLLVMAVSSALVPMFGLFIFALLALAMPLLLAWVGVMVSVGFTTAYYIPLLPYMIFTFGSLAWLISVIEAMVAAPIVALGVTHPEGHDAFGKGEAAIMILMNVFLRPAMMIIGYIAAIALCYVGIWILNAGFDHAIGFIQASPDQAADACTSSAWGTCDTNSSTWSGEWGSARPDPFTRDPAKGSGTGGYSDWAGVYAYFFSILLYTTMYLVIVQKAFTLISYLPDKVLRWIGGSPESLGQESSQWGEEVKSKTGEAGKGTQDAQAQMGSKLGGYGQKALGGAAGPGAGGSATATGGDSSSESKSDDSSKSAAADAAKLAG